MSDTSALDAELLAKGTPNGLYEDAGKQTPLRIPDGCRVHHVHLVGRPGAGKNSVLMGMILDELRRERCGAAASPKPANATRNDDRA